MKKDLFLRDALTLLIEDVNLNMYIENFIQVIKKEFDNLNDISAVYKIIHTMFPANSMEFAMIDNFIRNAYFRKKYPDEFILAIRKDEVRFGNKTRESNQQRRLERYEDLNGDIQNYDQSNPMLRIVDGSVFDPRFYHRWEVEWEPNFVQFSVSSIIKTIDDFYILLKCTHGVLDGKYTMIQGHCAYDRESFIYTKDFSLENFIKYSLNEVYREIEEEIGVEPKFIAGPVLDGRYTTDVPTTYIAPVYDDITNVSFYHNGLSFLLSTSLTKDEILNYENPEKDKHEICAFTYEELKKLPETCECDHWLSRALTALKL